MPTKPPPAPQSAPTAAKVAALIGWYVIVGLLLVRGEISAERSLIAAGAPLGVVLGIRAGDWIRALLIKR